MSNSSAGKLADITPADPVLAEYHAKLNALQTSIAKSQSRQVRALIAGILGVLLSVGLLYLALGQQKAVSAALGGIPLMGVVLALRVFFRHRAESLDQAHRSTFYERGIDRLQGSWRGKGNTGVDFARENHLYQSDLAVLGEGSVFELFCTTRSQVGADRLAAFLLDPPTLEEARVRQDAVKELRGAVDLREEIASLGGYQFQECDGLVLRQWLDAPILILPGTIPIFLLISSLVCLMSSVLAFAGIVTLSQAVPVLIPFLIAQTIACIALSRHVRPGLKKLRALTGEFVVLRQGTALMRRQDFRSAKLRTLAKLVGNKNAAAQLQKLERLVYAVERREDALLYLPSLLLAAAAQLVLTVDRWRTKHQKDFMEWLDAWAEFETLNAVACYAYENPGDIFPDLVDGAARFEAQGLSHPLIPHSVSIRNDVSLGHAAAFNMVSGSNMAGKSTFLRALGTNAILASAGAPIRAVSARISVFNICASISIADSLFEGKSKFLAEVERLRETIHCASAGQPVLFLIDEILSGTNSGDRRIVARSVIEALVAAGAVGALSTHDLALTDIADTAGLRGVNVHMESENSEDPLDFDYLVKPGVSRRANALAIVRMMGIHP